jgi:hypothetical protein
VSDDRVLIVSEVVSDDLHPEAKEGAASRRLVATTGKCPCGAMLELPDVLERGGVSLVFLEHEPGCPAADGVEMT